MNPAPNFNLLARPYRWMEYLSFGPLLQRARTQFLPQAAGCRRALALGDGDGRFTAALLAANPAIRVHAVDASPAMLQVLTRRCKAHADRLTTEVADLRQWVPEGSPEDSYDLVATHFFLDCLTTEEVARLVQRVTPATGSRTLWLLSDFALPATALGRMVATPLVTFLYAAFRLLTGLRVRRLPNHAEGLTAAGWICRTRRPRLRGILVSELWELRERRQASSANPNALCR